MNQPQSASPLGQFAELTRAALACRTVDDLVEALCVALERLGLVSPEAAGLDSTLRHVTRLTVIRVASGAGPAAEVSRLRRLVHQLGTVASPPEGAVDVWMDIAAGGIAALRLAYLAGLADSARKLAGTNVVAIADISGDAIMVHSRGNGKRGALTDRVTGAAQDVVTAVAQASTGPGVFCVGRLLVRRHDRPSRTLLDGAIDAGLTATGLPAIVARAQPVRTAQPIPAPTPVLAVDCRVPFGARVALRVAS